MKSRITKIAAAAVLIIAVLIGMNQFGGSIDGASVAWADVVENVNKLKTLTFNYRLKEKDPPTVKLQHIAPHLLRIEHYADGKTWILNTDKGKALILDSVKKTGKLCSGQKRMTLIYDAFRRIHVDMEKDLVAKVGKRSINGREAIGFKMQKEIMNQEHEIVTWIDPETKLPVLVEDSFKDAQGQMATLYITDIVFDAELDQSLFSLEPPEEYEMSKFDGVEYANRVKSAVRMGRILSACRRYVEEHNGQWPDSLQELSNYGIDAETLTNPRQPGRNNGYVYLKPAAPPSESIIILYEAYDTWGNGINVGLANYQLQYINDESDFKKRSENLP